MNHHSTIVASLTAQMVPMWFDRKAVLLADWLDGGQYAFPNGHPVRCRRARKVILLMPDVLSCLPDLDTENPPPPEPEQTPVAPEEQATPGTISGLTKDNTSNPTIKNR